ncbi:MAG: hypothetical protein IJR14_01830 [Synergistaceae bacterium]|nr:hypothetical protein [Synergistaceae bacterium]
MEARNELIEREKDLPEEARQALEHYGATLDDSGEPDEPPESEGPVTMPTPEEQEQERAEWAAAVAERHEGGGETV